MSVPKDPNQALVTLLRCLDRDDVSVLELCSGQAAKATRAQGSVALTKTPLSAAQISSLVQGTPIAEHLVANHGAPKTWTCTLAGRSLRVVVQRTDERVRVAIARPQQPQKDDGAMPPAPQERPSPSGAIELPPAPTDASISLQSSTMVAGHPRPPQPVDEGIDLGDQGAVAQALIALAGRDASGTHAAAFASTATPAFERALSLSAALTELDAIVRLGRVALASDIHLTPDEPVRHRCAGKLAAPTAKTLGAAAIAALAQGLISPQERQRLEASGYVDCAIALPTQGRVRANISRHVRGFKISMRLVPLVVPTLQTLQLPEDLAAVSRYHQGLAIVSGPSGHGKTATLAALVDRINQHSAHHIICIEDPIEVVHPVARALISQRQVGRDTASYARALKACLREDPDVIVVGELRDKETVDIALGAAETGHLVLATMNTRSASKTIDRLIDLFPPEDQAQVRSTLAGSLKMVISQRLLPSARGTLVPAVELLTGGVPLWALIRDNKLFQLPSLQQRGRSAGMIRLDTSLVALVQEGQVQAEVARGYAENVAEFDRMLAAGRSAPATAAANRGGL